MSFDVSGNAYDRFMGRYARELAPVFADFAGVHEGAVVDVGCGSGILTEELARRVGAGKVAAADPSPLLEACRERVPEADVRNGTAEDLPWPDVSFEAALAQLVLHFLDEPVVGLLEMQRVTRPGGVVAASSWNFPQMPLLRTFWDSARSVVPAAPGETQYFDSLEEFAELGPEARLDEVEVAALDVSIRYEGFPELWSTFELGVGPAGEFYATLPDDARRAIRDEYHTRLGSPAGSFDLPAQAWGLRGTVPT
jgi:ubiquinone/menaquinone biosynthesis C-methylase UbiE